MLSNVKNAITGTFHSISRKHVPRYLAEFEYRFNRRYDLPAMIEHLAFVAERTPPMSYRLITMAETYGQSGKFLYSGEINISPDTP